jgi:hypothetical protein
LHVGTRNEKDPDARAGGSPVSSFYSPGKKYDTWRFMIAVIYVKSNIAELCTIFFCQYLSKYDL